jgi:hypothetical protein
MSNIECPISNVEVKTEAGSPFMPLCLLLRCLVASLPCNLVASLARCLVALLTFLPSCHFTILLLLWPARYLLIIGTKTFP